jgi:tRNA pseudouridine38-40 synthase
MSRFFLELSYKGTSYSGFQVQENANTVQAEVEKALAVLLREKVSCTGSSRTDAGVHAFQNYFHFDFDGLIPTGTSYRLNAILPADIAVKSLWLMAPGAHCRFDAVARRYQYVLYERKDPFLEDRAWFYPYPLDTAILNEASLQVLQSVDFTSFAKRNSQVKTFDCRIMESAWERTADGWIYRVQANRFLRGMVRGLVGTMLQAGRGKLSLEQFKAVIDGKNNQEADFSAPGKGLYLVEVIYPSGYFEKDSTFIP